MFFNSSIFSRSLCRRSDSLIF